MITPKKPSVLDACALIAFLQDEEGADVTEDALTDSSRDNYVHAINLCEMYYHFWRQDNQATAEAAVATVMGFGVAVREDMDAAFWRQVGRHKVLTQPLSLGDCCCLALAERLGAELITSDHREFDPVAALGLCPILFIR